MSKVTWKRTRKGIQFIEKKTFTERMQNMSFMQTAMFLFAVELVLFLAALSWAVATAGNAGWPVNLMGIAILVLGCIGVAVTLYGHYTVEAESRLNWKIGLYTNGIAAAGMLILSLVGIIAG